MTAKTVISVVVCTLDRADSLQSCLASLSPDVQTIVEPYEVIVVDQTPRERRSTVKDGFARVIHRDQSSLSAARNAGAQLAGSDIVAFIDDDAVAASDWLEMLANVFAHDDGEGVLACGGRVMADYGTSEAPEWLDARLERFLSCVDFRRDAGPLRPGEWLVGTNLAFRRRMLLSCGGFDETLGRRGSAHLLSNEESALIERIGRDHVIYEPRAVVRHCIPRERLRQSWFRRRICWQAVSDVLSGAQYLADRAVWNETRPSSPTLERSVRSLFQPVQDAAALEDQLEALYDVVADALMTGTPTFHDYIASEDDLSD